MAIGIGGAGGKLAYKLDSECTVVNVSDSELRKIPAGRRILASVHAEHGQMRGSRKDPQIGRDAFLSVRAELLHLVEGELVLSSTGGGTGNGIVTGLLEELTARDVVPQPEKTSFALILPYPQLEPAEFVANTVGFLRGPLSDAIDSGNTGNIYLFSNRLKYETRATEEDYNTAITQSLKAFQAIPRKGDNLKLLDGHIDHEDFALYCSKPYFNHFTYFDYDPERPFGEQFSANYNPHLLRPENPIEALFLLEVPPGGNPTSFYDILEHFSGENVMPVFGVVENPERDTHFITVSVLYSRKPAELVEDFNRISHEHTQAKVRKSLEQHIPLPVLEVSLENETRKEGKQRGAADEDILTVLRRLGKL
jgi:hypothetical protein